MKYNELQIRDMAKKIDILAQQMTKLCEQIENSGHPYADQMAWHLNDVGCHRGYYPLAEGLVGMYLEGGDMRKKLDKTIEGKIRWNLSDYKG